MAYKLKYFGECLDYYGRIVRCEIHSNAFSGKPKEMEFGGKAVTLTRTARGITDVICGMGVNIEVWCNVDGEYRDLFSTSDKQNMVVVYVADDVVFRGFVDPELYSEEFIAPPYTITIPASDGLSSLEDYQPDFDFSIESHTLLYAICKSLQKTGLELPIFINCSLMPIEISDNVSTLFEHVSFDTEILRSYLNDAWQADNGLSVISDILKTFGCRIYQSNDKWFIERIKNKCDESWRWVEYDYTGNKKGIILLDSDDVIILDTDDVCFINSPASLEIDSGYGKQTVNIDYKKYDSIIHNDFSKGFIDGSAYFSIGNITNCFLAPERKWLICNKYDTPKEFRNFRNISHGFKFSNPDVRYNTTLFGIKSKLSHTDSNPNPGVETDLSYDKFRLSYKVSIDNCLDIIKAKLYYLYCPIAIGFKPIGISKPVLWVKLDSKGGFLSYHSDFTESGIVLAKGTNFVDRVLGVEINIEIDYPYYPDLNFQKEIFVYMPEPIEYAHIGSSQYTALPDVTYIGDFECKSTIDNTADNTIEATVNTNYRRSAPDISMKFHDLPNVQIRSVLNEDNILFSGVDINYYNGLTLTSTKKPTSKWIDFQESEKSHKLYERMLVDNFDQYYDPREKLSGEVLTNKIITPNRIYKIVGRDKSYLLTGVECNLAESVYKLNIEEIKKQQVRIGDE